MKIVAINPSNVVGGAERSMMELVSQLVDRGHRIWVVAPPGGSFRTTFKTSTATFVSWRFGADLGRVGRYSSMFTVLRSSLGVVRACWHLGILCFKIKPDIVYSNGVKSHLITGILSPALRGAVVWHVRDFVASRRVSGVLFWLARARCIKVIANSHAVANEWLVRRVDVEVVHNGFDRSEKTLVGPCPRSDSGLRVLAAGVIARWKGFEVVIRACSQLPSSMKWTLTICGDEIYQTDGHVGELKRLLELVKSLGIEDRVRFCGMVPSLSPYFRSHDVFVHASLRPEPFGRVVAESLLDNCAVIASNGGGIPEIIRDGIDGWLYEMGNIEQLRDLLVMCHDFPIVSARAVEQGFERIRSDFNLEGKATAVEAIFESRL